MNPSGDPAGQPASQMAARLLAVDWDGDEAMDHPRSRGRLMKEYLRRAALWANHLAATDAWPFFDIAARVDPTVRADPAIVFELTAIATQIAFVDVRTSCVGAVHWAALRGAKGDELPELPDPFEPLLVMYERGGGFVPEHGALDLGGVLVRKGTWRDHLAPDPVVSLDPAALDALDNR